MKRTTILCLLLICIIALSGCRLFEYRLAWELPTNRLSRVTGEVFAEGFEVRDVYYSADPLAVGGQNGVVVIMQNALGFEPSGDVIWHNSDDSVGYLEPFTAPSRKSFIAQPTGSFVARETIVSAEFDGEVASTKVIVFPSRRLFANEGKIVGLDFDGDAINDFEIVPGEARLHFPFGAYIVDMDGVFPWNLGDMVSDEHPAPAMEDTFIGTNDRWARGVFNTSKGLKYAGLFGGGIVDGISTGTIIWRPL